MGKSGDIVFEAGDSNGKGSTWKEFVFEVEIQY